MGKHKQKGKDRGIRQEDLHALKRVIKVRGVWGIDQRTTAAKSLLGWKRAIISDLGGESEVTRARMSLVDMAARTLLFIESLDSFLLAQKSLLNEKTKSVIPVLLERQKLVDSLGKLLVQIGLKRQARKVLSLQEYWSKPVTETADDGDEERGDAAKDDSGCDERSGAVSENVS